MNEMSEVERVTAANQVHPLQAVQQCSQFNTLDFPQPVKRFVLWSPPKQRQRWGDETTLPHINWGDLFFDLFYVLATLRAAFSVSSCYAAYFSLRIFPSHTLHFATRVPVCVQHIAYSQIHRKCLSKASACQYQSST